MDGDGLVSENILNDPPYFTTGLNLKKTISVGATLLTSFNEDNITLTINPNSSF